MEFETPAALLARLRLGREEFCQRLLTSLILHAPYPRWNTRSQPCARGIVFLRSVYEQTFRSPWPGDGLVFVDEFELPPRLDTERGGAPDYAVLWPDRLWLIELKTERSSHRVDQIPTYFDLAHHHYPDASIDILYLTPPMSAPHELHEDWARYAHAVWPNIVPLIHAAWPSATDRGQDAVLEGLLTTIETLDLRVADWRAMRTNALPSAESDARELHADMGTEGRDTVREALHLAALTAADGQQRAVAVASANLDELLTLRFAVRDSLATSPHDSPLRCVLPWLWRWESQGRPLSKFGEETGRELRLSRYTTPRY